MLFKNVIDNGTNKESLLFCARDDDTGQLHIFTDKLGEEENGLRAPESIFLFLSLDHLEDIGPLQFLIGFLVRFHDYDASPIFRNNLSRCFLGLAITDVKHPTNEEISSVVALLVVDNESFVALLPGLKGTELHH